MDINSNIDPFTESSQVHALATKVARELLESGLDLEAVEYELTAGLFKYGLHASHAPVVAWLAVTRAVEDVENHTFARLVGAQ